MLSDPKLNRRKPGRGIIFLVFFTVIIARFAVPSFLWVEKSPPERPAIVFEGETHGVHAVIDSKEAYVPFSFLKERIDPDALLDEDLIIITTKDKVVKLGTGSLTAYVNQNPMRLEFPVIQDRGEPYIPASTLRTVYSLSTTENQDASLLLVQRLDQESVWRKVLKDSVVRTEPSFFSRRVGVVRKDTWVKVYELKGSRFKVETELGFAGYLPQNSLGEERTDLPVMPSDPKPVFPDHLGKKVNLTWEQVSYQTPDPTKFNPMPGLNVVSPTWFHLSDAEGNLQNLADLRYVEWAKAKDLQVWALFSNSFDPERTHAVLRNSDLRDRVIAQLLVYCDVYSLDGINIDFENVYQEDAGYLTQFVRELTPCLHEAGLFLSIDITVKSQNPTWSLCYERKRLAEVADYVMLMAYDQYTTGSKYAGPTAAIPWTEWAIQKTLEEVPEEKLVLGIPLYTRLWEEKEDGVSETAYTMKDALRWVEYRRIEPKPHEESGLKYVEEKIGDVVYKMWLEDCDSIKRRVELCLRYDLAGIASWCRGYEAPEVWREIEQSLLVENEGSSLQPLVRSRSK